ncbi:hypothetical protein CAUPRSCDRAFT_12751 [Caulochytrium protostelioides]|nr:hypothetical protein CAUPRSCDRAFT_12751 [Caulochytrium protostelioides]
MKRLESIQKHLRLVPTPSSGSSINAGVDTPADTDADPSEGAIHGANQASEDPMLGILSAEGLLQPWIEARPLWVDVAEWQALMLSGVAADIQRVNKACSARLSALMSEKDTGDLAPGLPLESPSRRTGQIAPILLTLAQSCALLHQGAKARNHLKQLVQMPWHPSIRSEYEAALLLLIDLHIQGNQLDAALKLVQTCLKRNASCLPALEYRGLIAEKQGRLADASACYDAVWRALPDAAKSSVLGFRLASSHAKTGHYTDAIDVCHVIARLVGRRTPQVDDLLQRARASLRLGSGGYM